MKFTAIVALVAAASAYEHTKNSEFCADDQVKGVSLVKNKCGESCVGKKAYYFFKLFESGMFKADDNAERACAKAGFSTYIFSEKHVVPGTEFGVKVDFYQKDGTTPDPKYLKLMQLKSVSGFNWEIYELPVPAQDRLYLL